MKGETPLTFLFANVSKVWGGGEMWYYQMAGALSRLGHKVSIIAYPGTELALRARKKGVVVYEIGVRSIHLLDPILQRKLSHIIKKCSPDFLVVNGSHELKVIGLLAKKLKVPHIILRRGVSYPIKSNSVNRWYIKNVLTEWITISESVYKNMLTSFPLLEEKSHLLLFNGIDLSVWRVDPKIKKEKNLLSFVGRLSPEKGIDRCIAAVEILRERGISVTLDIWGEGPQKDELADLIQRKHLQGKVFLKGFTDSLPNELGRSELFIFTPRFGEGSSRVLLEAMAIELPCIVMDTPSMDEVVIDGETGFVVPDGKVHMMADKIQYMLEHSELRQQFGKSGKERVIRQFSFDIAVENAVKWFQGLLQST